ncbi:hypothetical protein AOQ84DRAFT_433668, partial [Glonium stellatum]
MSEPHQPAGGWSARNNHYLPPNTTYNPALQEAPSRVNVPLAPLIDDITPQAHYGGGNKSYRAIGENGGFTKRKRYDSDRDVGAERGYDRKQKCRSSDNTLASIKSIKGVPSSASTHSRAVEVVSLLSSDEEEIVEKSKTSSKAQTKATAIPVADPSIQNVMEKPGATLSLWASHDGQNPLAPSSRYTGPPPYPRKTPIPPPLMPGLGSSTKLKARSPSPGSHISLQTEQEMTTPRKSKRAARRTTIQATDIQVISSSSSPSSSSSSQSE